MTWPGHTEHQSLYQAAKSLIALLRNLPAGLRPGHTMHMFHADAANRCKSLSITLESGLTLCERDFYGPAFGLLRTALEHTLVDQLVFSGKRYVQIFRDVDEEVFATWEQERASGSKWQDVTEWRRSRKGEVRIVRQGLYSEPAEDGSRQVIGPHYFLLRDFTPFVAPPAVHEQEDDGLSTAEDRKAYAERNRFMYEVYLKWPSLKESLKANGLASDRTLAQLDVHYRFLSAFVHPISDVTKLLYGKDALMGWPKYDHYSSELVLLYVVVLAVVELRNFGRLAQREPTVEVEEWERIEAICDAAWELSSHLWYPGQQPYAYDRWQEANRRVWANFRENQQQTPPTNPADLPESEIRYYQNPLSRLVELHFSSREISTGIPYVSPWPRRDAQFGR